MTSELDKWAEVHPDVVVIEDFLAWLEEKQIYLATPWKELGGRLLLCSKMHRELVEEYFNINAYKLEMERRSLLKEYMGA